MPNYSETPKILKHVSKPEACAFKHLKLAL